jgi:hypothetical protein
VIGKKKSYKKKVFLIIFGNKKEFKKIEVKTLV